MEVVDHLRPKFWAMENVPRVGHLLAEHLTLDGALSAFLHLAEDMDVRVFDMSAFGLPQRRKRCIAGNFPFDLLEAYSARCEPTTLGDVLLAVEDDPIVDVNFGFEAPRAMLTEMEKEPFLDNEEERINRTAKTHHRVYNGMAFPDPIDRPVRTVTATCTRVSRESVIIEDLEYRSKYRRLTLREHALLQGFPITYEFFGKSYSEKLRMVGNAIPPVFAYYVAHAMQGTNPDELKLLRNVAFTHRQPERRPVRTPPDQIGRSFPANRRFRFAIPNLRFKSGTRFDFVNQFKNKVTSWGVEFYFGPSRDIRTFCLNHAVHQKAMDALDSNATKAEVNQVLQRMRLRIAGYDVKKMQDRWANKSGVGPHPFAILDELGQAAQECLSTSVVEKEEVAISFLGSLTSECYPNEKSVGSRKLAKYAVPILCGLLIGSAFNAVMEMIHWESAA